ncbi:MAG TPA: DUF5615 family PIN-like protein, partial [Acidobacteriaceae bacterium]|nr:DUF5615 family PIN-like protein [Acidobacteriaceae bacterium]
EVSENLKILAHGSSIGFSHESRHGDWNVTPSRRTLVRGAQVVTVQEADLRRHPDENHAAFALRYGYILLTCDRDYLDNRKFPLIHCSRLIGMETACEDKS